MKLHLVYLQIFWVKGTEVIFLVIYSKAIEQKKTVIQSMGEKNFQTKLKFRIEFLAIIKLLLIKNDPFIIFFKFS